MDARSTSVASNASSSDLYQSSASGQDSSTPATFFENGATSAKRKRGSDDGSTGKKTKVSRLQDAEPPASLPFYQRLPPAVWQNIFLHTDNVQTFGRLMQVNRAFNRYLTSTTAGSDSRSVHGRLHVLNSETLWDLIRKRKYPNLPKPLAACSQREMWRLILSKRCQFCGKLASAASTQNSPFASGPGQHGIRPIWAFAIVICGPCLEANSRTESSLLFSTSSSLLPALPYVFLTSDLHVVSSSTIQDSHTVPTNIIMVKRYYSKHVNDMERQLQDARELGPAAAEEWFKGLEIKGRETLNDAARWERWEDKGGVRQLLSRNTDTTATTSPAHNPLHIPERPPSTSIISGTASSLPRRPLPPPKSMQSSFALPHGPASHFPQPRIERTVRDANEAKAARRRDIERRCLELEPPITPNILSHMDAFQAAIQISVPMTDKAWDVLKPRLLHQRDAAERAEAEKAEQNNTFRVKLEDRFSSDTFNKEVKEALEHEWEEIQKPIRQRLSTYADDIISNEWACGRSVTRDNCSKFAAEVLIRVRQRFYSDILKDDQKKTTRGPVKDEMSESELPRILVLENMKWVFDNKIKPITEHFRKDLFLCNSCDGNYKFYGFEGVIQHFGAKHTNSFSVGNVVVSWQRAEWPEEPPFHPDPTMAKSTPLLVPSGLSLSGAGFSGHPAPAPYQGYGGYTRGATTTPTVATLSAQSYPQMSPGPYGQSQFQGHHSGPFAPPPLQGPIGYPSHEGNYQAFQHNYGQPASNEYQYRGQPQGPYPPAPVDAYHSPNGYYSPHSGQLSGGPIAPPVTYPVETMSRQADRHYQGQFAPVPPTNVGSTGRSYNHTGRAPFHGQGPPPVKSNQEELNALSDMARLLWNNTSGVQDLSLSVRLYVIVHHVFLQFKNRFNREPSLDLFINALTQNQSLRPLKASNELFCKSCAEQNTNHQHSESAQENLASYNIESLAFHFKFNHFKGANQPGTSSGQSSSESKWNQDMIDLPEDVFIADLIRAPGMTEEKRKIFADVFPNLFISARARYSPIQEIAPEPEVVKVEALSRPNPVQSSKLSRAKDESEPPSSIAGMRAPNTPSYSLEGNGVSGFKSQEQSPQVASADEYDPRRPALDYKQPVSRTQRTRISRERSPPVPHRKDAYYQGSAVYEPEAPYEVVCSHPVRSYYRARSPREARPHHEIYTEPNAPPARFGYPHDANLNDRAMVVERRDQSVAHLSGPPSQHGNQPLAHSPHGQAPESQVPSRPVDPAAAAELFLERFSKENNNNQNRFQDAGRDTNHGRPEVLNGQALPDIRYQTENMPHGPPVLSHVPNTEHGPHITPSPLPPSQRPISFSEPYYEHARSGSGSYSYPPPEQDRSRMLLAGNERFARPTSPRSSRHVSVYHEDSSVHGQSVAPPRGRYEQYEAEHRGLVRERSRSPRPPHRHDSDHHRFRRRSPEPPHFEQGYHRTPLGPPRHEYVAYDGPSRRSPGPPPIHYRPVNGPPVYHGEYQEPVEYVRVAAYAPPTRYVPGRPGGPDEVVEYVSMPYERGPPRAPVYNEREYVYAEERRRYQ